MMSKKTLLKSLKIFVLTGLLLAHLPTMIQISFAAPTCANLVKPEEIKDYVITVLEERITPVGKVTEKPKGNTEENGILNCVRKTEIEPNAEGKAQYVEIGSCKPVVPGIDPNTGQDTGTRVVCQGIQVIYAKSGAGLLYTYVGLIYRWSAGTVGIVTVLYLVIGGIRMAMAQGDTGQFEKAKEQITNSIAGLVLLFLSALILYTINPNFFIK